jgi:hypothetical protein
MTKARTRPYKIIEGELYKEGVCSRLLKYVSREEGQELIKEIHYGLCGLHIGLRALLGKNFDKVSIGRRQFWTQQSFCISVTIVKDAQETKRNLHL